MMDPKFSSLYWYVIRDCLNMALASKDPRVDEVRYIIKRIIKRIDDLTGNSSSAFWLDE
jgi:hypothetical protein